MQIEQYHKEIHKTRIIFGILVNIVNCLARTELLISPTKDHGEY